MADLNHEMISRAAHEAALAAARQQTEGDWHAGYLSGEKAGFESGVAAARQVDEARLTEVRGLVGKAHATLCLMWGAPDVKRAQSSLQQAQSILAALLAALTIPEPEEKR